MARGVAIGLLIIGAIALFLLWPFNGEPKPATLHLQFTEGFDNEEVEIKLDGDVVFNEKVKTDDALNPPPQIWHATFVGKNHKAEVVVRVSPFIREFSKFEITMMKSGVWVLISRGENDVQKWTSFDFQYGKPFYK